MMLNVNLGVHIVAASSFKCSFDHLKSKFYRIFNCLYTRSKAANSKLVTVQLVKSYCMPIILYCLEALHVSSTACNSFNNCINQAVYKIFEIREKSNIYCG